MEIFSEPPISFNLDLKSQQATNLKRWISDHLRRHFSDDYSDDVLADYITVLVCNGKNQNQARDDLDAFLGERSVAFVSWLWNLLLKGDNRVKSPASAKHLDHMAASPQYTKEDQDPKVERISELKGLATTQLSNSVIVEGKKDSSYDASDCKKRVLDLGLLPVKDTPSEAYDVTKSRRIRSNPHISMHSSPFHAEETRIVHTAEKITSEKCNDLPYLCSFPRRESASKNISSLSDTPHSIPYKADVVGRSYSRAAIASSSQSSRIRRSVWDRLGRPDGNVPSGVMNLDIHGNDRIACSKELIDQHSSLLSVPSGLYNAIGPIGVLGNFSKVGKGTAEYEGINHDVTLVTGPEAVNQVTRKRPLDDITTSLGASVTMKNGDSTCEEVVQAGRRQLAILEGPQATSSQVHNVKLRLHHTENEMSKLREKHVVKEKEGSDNLTSKSGSQKSPQEDIESRSVLVTNVHFVATREALSLYFGKCGRIVGVFIVSNDGSSFPRRPKSACITFASNESADKALEMSGMPFYSRNIKVARFAGKATLSSFPVPYGGKPAQTQTSLLKRSMKPDLSWPTSLQWRRESTGLASSVPSAQSNSKMDVAATSASLMKGNSGEVHQASISDEVQETSLSTVNALGSQQRQSSAPISVRTEGVVC